MRIISGKFKGINLYGPKDKKIRPLKDMVRESIFNFLAHSNKISFKLEGSNILDLYSGTGSFGLECLSRRANKIIFVEKQSQKGMLIGQSGSRLKSIGTASRVELEELLGSKIMLKTLVKVKSGWSDNESVLPSMGYDLDI